LTTEMKKGGGFTKEETECSERVHRLARVLEKERKRLVKYPSSNLEREKEEKD